MTLRQAGFTLVELLIVLSMLATITMFMVLNVRFLDRLVVRSELEHLHMVCRYLQAKALATHEKQLLSFDISRNAYTFEGTSYQLPSSVTFGVLGNTYGPPAHPVKPIKQPITFNNNEIVFHETGVISAGTAYFVDMKLKNLYALTAAVAPVSFIRLYHHGDSWQLVE